MLRFDKKNFIRKSNVSFTKIFKKKIRKVEIKADIGNKHTAKGC